jgi:CRISPR system Cascade subunit CasA
MADSNFNLLTQPWLPLKRRSGRTEWVSPADITRDQTTDPFVSPDWGRADFDAATYEFLIGLLATAFHPEDERDWRELWSNPPDRAALETAFLSFHAAFNLTGDGPRFMQELGGVEGETSSITGLFIESPGANTEKNNADLFQKRGRFPQLGLEAAAMALFTLQTYAPSGGAGHRTSLRGGGPLTTLVMPADESAPLWSRLWLNLPLTQEPLPQADGGPKVFPWLGTTQTSEKGTLPISAEDMHPLSAFWWMPRRIRLELEEDALSERCAVTGQETLRNISTYRTRPWGMNGVAPQHPLSPMYRNKANDLEWLFVHPQPGGLPYHLWVDLAFVSQAKDSTRKPAEIVSHIGGNREGHAGKPVNLRAFGYDMDNMKARGFVDVAFPLFLLPDEDAQQSLAGAARNLVQAATTVAIALRSAVRTALNIEKADAAQMSALSLAFYEATQAAFLDGIEELSKAFSTDSEDGSIRAKVGRKFLDKSLLPAALRLFDEAAPLVALGARLTEVQRLVKARQGLVFALGGYGRDGKTVFDALALPLPETKTAKVKTPARTKVTS